jgi:D-alanine-D-alanine ligase
MVVSKLRIGVFMGGRSVENEASFNSGRTICDHLDTARYDVIPIFQRRDGKLFILPWHFLHRGKITDFEQRLATQAQAIGWDDLPALVDFIYLAIHGRYAEDGCLQGFLEVLGIPYLGSSILTSALCMEKVIQKDMLAAHGFSVPRGLTLPAHTPLNITSLTQTLETLGVALPYIVKPHAEGSSLGVSVVTTLNNLEQAIEKARYIQPDKPQTVLIEEYIEGMEFSCIMLYDDHNKLFSLPITEIVPETGSYFFTYDQKYMPGRATKFTPARCSKEQHELIQQTCICVTEVFNIATIARIDGFLTPDNRVIIIEANTLAGMGPTSFIFRQAAEMNMAHKDLINHLIATELRNRGIDQKPLM